MNSFQKVSFDFENFTDSSEQAIYVLQKRHIEKDMTTKIPKVSLDASRELVTFWSRFVFFTSPSAEYRFTVARWPNVHMDKAQRIKVITIWRPSDILVCWFINSMDTIDKKIYLPYISHISTIYCIYHISPIYLPYIYHILPYTIEST